MAASASGWARAFRRPRFLAFLTAFLAAAATVPLASSAASATASAAGRAALVAGGVAPGAPGSMSYFDLARKDCVGTATGTASKVWYTVAGC